MSSIETQPTEFDRARVAQVANMWRSMLVTVGLIILWLSFEPFSGGQDYESGGSLINQIGYTAITGLALLTLAMFVHPAFLLRFCLHPGCSFSHGCSSPAR